MRHHILDHPHTGIAAKRHDRFRVELHRCHRLLRVLDAHDRAVFAFRRDHKIAVKRGRIGEDRVVATDGDFAAQTGKDETRLENADARGLAMHRDRQLAKLSAIGFRQRLEPEADAEDRQLARTGSLDRRLAIEIAGVARSGRENHEIRLEAIEDFRRNRCANGRDRRTRLPEVIRQRMHEAVFVIDQQDLHARSDLGRITLADGRILGFCIANGCNHGRCLQFGFRFFFLWNGIVQ